MKVYILNYFYNDDVYSQTVYKTFDAARNAMMADIHCVEKKYADKGFKRLKRLVYSADAYLKAKDCDWHKWEIDGVKFIDK